MKSSGENEWTDYKSIDDVPPQEWDKVNKSKTFTGKLFHPSDKHNPVTQPDHYNKGAIEAIEAIKASMHPQEYKGYLKGNCLKYLCATSTRTVSRISGRLGCT